MLSLILAITLLAGVSGCIGLVSGGSSALAKRDRHSDSPLKFPLAQIEEPVESEQTSRSLYFRLCALLAPGWPCLGTAPRKQPLPDKASVDYVPHTPLYIAFHSLKIPHYS